MKKKNPNFLRSLDVPSSQNVNFNLIIITLYLAERNNVRIDHVDKPLPQGLAAIAPVPFNKVKLAVKRYYRDNPAEDIEDLIDLAIAGE